jgi:hypothetical protein
MDLVVVATGDPLHSGHFGSGDPADEFHDLFPRCPELCVQICQESRLRHGTIESHRVAARKGFSLVDADRAVHEGV